MYDCGDPDCDGISGYGIGYAVGVLGTCEYGTEFTCNDGADNDADGDDDCNDPDCSGDPVCTGSGSGYGGNVDYTVNFVGGGSGVVALQLCDSGCNNSWSTGNSSNPATEASVESIINAILTSGSVVSVTIDWEGPGDPEYIYITLTGDAATNGIPAGQIDSIVPTA